ncbi:hypothetical protein [Aquimarina megaterium]|uniref:hypothetical protein n=1 Tax=Aquimarina megaterium TaxID=1443666 RepID=UPI000941DAAA|nr:hypothetical protein [Aquimarina megaterium]
MVKEIYQIKKALGLLLLCVILTSCQPPKEQDLLDEARFNFENITFDRGIDKVPFKGPIIKDRIENFKADPGYKVYGWYYVHRKDTIWVYAKVDTLLQKETSIHFSRNITKYIEELDRRMQ